MLANISVEQALIKAKSHENKGELAEAQSAMRDNLTEIF